MYLENVVVDAQQPQRLGLFWEQLLGCSTLVDEADAFETRLSVPDGPALDLCFQRVPTPPTPNPRLHLEVYGGEAQDQDLVVQRALSLGARHLDIGQRDVPWVVLADPEGNPFCVMEDRPEYAPSGPLSSLPLDSADVERDLRFWSELSAGPRRQCDAGALPSERARTAARALPRTPPAIGGEKNRITSTCASRRARRRRGRTR